MQQILQFWIELFKTSRETRSENPFVPEQSRGYASFPLISGYVHRNALIRIIIADSNGDPLGTAVHRDNDVIVKAGIG